MLCIRCQESNTKCIDDMFHQSHIGEIYKCNDCGGTIEVEYNSINLSNANIKSYRYIEPKNN